MGTPVRLLFIIDRYATPLAGTEGQLLKLLEGLDRARYQPRLAVLRDSEYLRDHSLPVPVDVLHVRRLLSPVSWLRLYRYFHRNKRAGFRLAHIFFNDASLICPPLLRLLGYRVIISRRDMGFWYTRARLLLLRFNTRFVDCVVANSRAVAELTVRSEGYEPGRLQVIYNGYAAAESPRFRTPPRHAAAPMRLVLVANIRPIKRIGDAVYAVHALAAAGVDCHLTVIGDGDGAELRALRDRLGVSGRVLLTGPSADIPGLLAHFDAGLLCSESEGFSNTLIEYQLAGLPVVCTATGGNTELVEHAVNGLLYPVGDVDALVAQLRRLADAPGQAAEMGRAGQQRVRREFGLSKLLAAHDTLYSGLTDGT